MSSLSGAQGYRAPTGSTQKSRIPQGYKEGSIQQFTPEQMQLFQQMFSHVSPDSYTAKLAGGDQGLFNEMEAPAMRQFNELQGGLASRFSGMGSGARRSSGFQNAATSAQSNFAQDLQGRRQELQRKAIQDLMGMSGDLLGQRPQEKFLVKQQPKQSFLQKFMGGALPLAGAAAGGFFGGPAGMAMGAQLGSSAGSAFSGGQSQGMDFSGAGNLPTNWDSWKR